MKTNAELNANDEEELMQFMAHNFQAGVCTKCGLLFTEDLEGEICTQELNLPCK